MSLTSDPTDILKIHQEKLKVIKCALFDVDGILTNGLVYYSGKEMGWNRFFNIYDGYGIKLLMQNNIHVGILSGGDSEGLKKRFIENLKIPSSMCYLGDENKRIAYQKIKKDLLLNDEQIMYMGDELFDIPILDQVGFSATVPNASFLVQKRCDYITQKKSGKGAAREVMDLILLSQNLIDVDGV